MRLTDEQYSAEMDTIAKGLDPAARVELISILGEALNTVDNLDVVCQVRAVYCASFLRFQRLRLLLNHLNTHAGSPSASASVPRSVNPS